jgi:Secretion system C-terminal sorting domain
MALIRTCILFAAIIGFSLCAKSQTIFYPTLASKLLKETALDVASLLQQTNASINIITQSYTGFPTKGIVLIYDSTITDNQACKVSGNGTDWLQFSAAEDNGLIFGLYQYLHQLGFRFYQPGTIWQITPSLQSVYKNIDTIFNTSYKYKGWFVSGGCSKWIMDNTDEFQWDTYTGSNGHQYAMYQRRNGMLGGYTFRGHRDDITAGEYLTTLKNNPCYVANSNGSREAYLGSVPNINNSAAMQLWTNVIQKKDTQYKKTIFNNKILYNNIYRNFSFYNAHVGLEVPDGAAWGNTNGNSACGSEVYPSESDQHFVLANFVAQKILNGNPASKFQLYAYSTHANVPSSNIVINNKIDVQIIPTVYQLESSTNGLRNRWYNKTSNVSEYHYLNLSNWSGETPSFTWKDLKTTLQIAKDKKSQGLVWEASPAKFGSLPFLLASNNFLKDGMPVDSTLKDFCNVLFGNANQTVLKIFQLLGNEKTIPNKYNIELYLELLKTATSQIKNDLPIVNTRLQELKAYFHYMMKIYDVANDDQNKAPNNSKKDAEICMYLARTNKLQLINSYYMIAVIVGKYGSTSEFYAKYNTANGTAYQNGNLASITNAEIEDNFTKDYAQYAGKINEFVFENAENIIPQFQTANVVPLPVITTKLLYTNGINYYNTTTFNIIATKQGKFSINYTPKFEMAGKGYINFLVESIDHSLKIIKDFSINNPAGAGVLEVDLPAAGNYLLTIVSKYQSKVDLTITTNGNYFYKNGAFLGSKTERYWDDLKSLPGFFYLPKGINKMYCRIENFNGYNFAKKQDIENAFLIKDENNNAVKLNYANAKDSSLFYMEIPEGKSGNFWQVSTIGQYSLQFVNTSNTLWFTQRSGCDNAKFTATIINKNGNCITRLTSTDKNTKNLYWLINDNGNVLKYSNQSEVDLPDNVSPKAIVTLTNGENCSFTKRLMDEPLYLRNKQNCAAGAPLANTSMVPTFYPNPSTGIFNCMQNYVALTADEINVFNLQGTRVASFKNVKQINLSTLPAGMYMYLLKSNGQTHSGKLVKM